MPYSGRVRDPSTVIIGDSDNIELFNVVGINPHVDLDTTYVWDINYPTLISQIEVIGLNKTKTIIYSRDSSGKRTGKAVIII